MLLELYWKKQGGWIIVRGCAWREVFLVFSFRRPVWKQVTVKDSILGLAGSYTTTQLYPLFGNNKNWGVDGWAWNVENDYDVLKQKYWRKQEDTYFDILICISWTNLQLVSCAPSLENSSSGNKHVSMSLLKKTKSKLNLRPDVDMMKTMSSFWAIFFLMVLRVIDIERR